MIGSEIGEKGQMENFLSNLLGAIIGTGIGGTIVYLASQKFIENVTKDRFDAIDKKLEEIEDTKLSTKDFEKFEKQQERKFVEFKEDYVPLKVYEVAQNFVNESLKEIKDMIRILSDKIDREK